MIIISHKLNIVKKHCDKAAILDAGVMTVFENMEEAFEIYRAL